ncbi:MAG: GNAT family N-acetyltransferase [Caldilinea sp.]
MTPADIDKLRELYTEYERIQAAFSNVQREVLPNLIRQTPRDPEDRGTIIYTRLDEGNADKSIRDQIAYFEQMGCAFEWKHYDYDTPPDLKERLRAHGFELEEVESIMALPLANAPVGLLKPVTHDVRRVHDPDQLEDIQRIKEAVWGEERSFISQFLRHTLLESPQQMSIYVAYAEDRPVSCGWIHFPAESPFASLWGGSTLASHRKLGFYTALLSVRVQEAIARGKQYLTIDASPMSRPIVERFGFVLLAESTPCIWCVRKTR